MPNDERVLKALALLTVAISGDQAAREVDLNWQGGCPEALGAMIRLSEGLVKLLADSTGVTPEAMLQEIALSIAGWE
jgi:hypothetical protein